MLLHIQDCLKGIAYSELPEKLDSLLCHATLSEGRRYTLAGCDGALSYSELVTAVYENVTSYAGKVEGAALHALLLKVEKRGKDALSKEHWSLQYVTGVREYLTSLLAPPHLEKIKQMQGYNSFASYAKSRKREVTHLIHPYGFGLPESFISFTETERCAQANVTIPQARERNYQGLLNFSGPVIGIDENERFSETFTRLTHAIQRTVPFWLQGRDTMNHIATELKRRVASTPQGPLFSHIQFEASTEIRDSESVRITYRCTLHRGKRGTQGLQLSPAHIDMANPQGFEQMKDQMLQNLEKTLAANAL